MSSHPTFAELIGGECKPIRCKAQSTSSRKPIPSPQTHSIVSHYPSAPHPFPIYQELSCEQSLNGSSILSYHRGGLQHKILRSLTSGKITAEMTLDLHGYTVKEAAEALTRTLSLAQRNQKRMLAIIHGKGNLRHSARLKSHINQWLPTIPQVLAFHSILDMAGQSGALMVILKSPQKQSS